MMRHPGMGSDPVQLSRRFGIDPEGMFELWTEPAHMRRWLHPTAEWSTPIVEVDVRLGGSYRLGFVSPEGESSFVIGRYLEIEAGRKLVYTWGWEPPDPHAGIETVVTVEFAPVDEGTEVTVTHEKFPEGEPRERHDEGWRGTFDQLGELVANR